MPAEYPASHHDLQLAILKDFAKNRQAQHKYNFLGRSSYQKGSFELALQIEFSKDGRHRARRALEDLVSDGFLQTTMTDLVDPDNWLEITEKGLDALARGTLDSLDEALFKINAHLVEVRRGAWSALFSKQPDALRQAAHSGRELIDQTLKLGAPDEVIKATVGFVPDVSSNTGITRRMRVKYLMQSFNGSVSETNVAVAEKAADLVSAIDKKLMAMAHSRSIPEFQEVRDAITTAEIALRNIFNK